MFSKLENSNPNISIPKIGILEEIRLCAGAWMALNSLKSLDRLQPEPPAPLKLRVFLGIAVLKLHFHGRDLIP